MKKLFLIIIIAQFAINHASCKKFQSTFKLGYEVGIGDEVKNNLLGGEYIGDFNLGRRFLLGLGLGSYISDFQTGRSAKDRKRKNAWIIPAFLDAKFRMLPEGSFRPYLLGNLGYSFLSIDNVSKEKAKLGAFVKLGLGSEIKMGNGGLLFEFFYKEQMQDVTDTGISLDDFKGIGVSVGYTF